MTIISSGFLVQIQNLSNISLEEITRDHRTHLPITSGRAAWGPSVEVATRKHKVTAQEGTMLPEGDGRMCLPITGHSGPKPSLPDHSEDQVETYIDVHAKAKLCRYRHEVWTYAEQLVAPYFGKV